ncbi:hypothetical protein [Bradyrhizobium japonicum]|uniref:hypothetical protein n=1 Tax=Bradyrhizobium japonicum TaxID=375 RepID=UPI00209C998E|nr:hypothetical protein [Bradyrhizobium japonicum]MCP1765395.1 hypothetical protein [Bradyrhizobium japonicum]MCP1787533.1 hypothetical protein [Bradyrhizobium japonicum]MCP1809409.1 hypothetical protein [Bradyrhizobium japonicum]MCP1818342.1 hypothetical protein [Bradyrhizobium japonicum]MCP1870148.1 hypothetical protein [Bradyrhizobium japonicum]
MTALSSYSTGTVAVAADGTTVTGTSTIWLTAGNVKPGDLFQSGHFCVPITDVTDDTHLVITPWPGSTLSGASYVIWKVSQQRIVGETYARDVDKMVGAFNTSGFFVFVDIAETVPDPSLGDDGQYAFQPTTGKTWAKVAGVWTYLGIYKAFQLKGAWSGTTAYAANDVVTLAGSSYVCVLDHTNHTPPNVTYWQLLAAKGDTGATPLLPVAAWVTATAYVAGPPASYVTNGGSSYMCLTSHTSGTFATDLAAGKWGLVSQAGTNAPTYGGTSTTSLAIGTGSKVFTTQAGLAYTNGARVRASSGANWLEGVATYSGTTLTITSDKTNGTGTFTSWTFNVAGQPGAGDVVAANNGTEFNAATFAANLGLVRGSVGHIPGDTTGSAPTTGEIGQRIQTTLAGTLSTTNTAVNCGSITLTPGNWDVSAAVIFNAASGATTGTDWWDILSTVSTPSTSIGNAIDGTTYHDRLASVADHSGVHTHAPWRMTVTVNTVIYCHAMATFSAGTGYGVSGTLSAVRAS